MRRQDGLASLVLPRYGLSMVRAQETGTGIYGQVALAEPPWSAPLSDAGRARLLLLEQENHLLRAEAKKREQVIQDLTVENRELRTQVEALSQHLARLKKEHYGPKRDTPPAPPPPAPPAPPAAPAAPLPMAGTAEADRAIRRRGQRPGTKGHGRHMHTELPTEDVVVPLPPGLEACPRCHRPRIPMASEDRSEEITFDVIVKRRIHHRPRYRTTCQCKDVPRIVTPPPPPKVIPKGKFSPELLAFIAHEKFALGRPLNRILQFFAAQHLVLSEGTLVGLLTRIAFLIDPLVVAIESQNRAASAWNVDETRWQVYERIDGKTGYRWYIWVFVARDTIFYRVRSTRGACVLGEHFDLREGDDLVPSGVVQSDRYVAYETLDGDRFVNLYCWQHARRQFLEASLSHPAYRKWSRNWNDRLGLVFDLQEERKKTEPQSPAYLKIEAALRKQIQAIRKTLLRQLRQEDDLPESALDALCYLDNGWEGFARIVDFPDQSPDNNAAERALRGPVVGRKNFYGSGSVQSANVAASLWTVFATCKRNGVNGLALLTAYLKACAENGGEPPSDLAPFLPFALSVQDKARLALPGTADRS